MREIWGVTMGTTVVVRELHRPIGNGSASPKATTIRSPLGLEKAGKWVEKARKIERGDRRQMRTWTVRVRSSHALWSYLTLLPGTPIMAMSKGGYLNLPDPKSRRKKQNMPLSVLARPWVALLGDCVQF